MKRLEQTWVEEVQQSRIVILPQEASYLAELDLPVLTVMKGMSQGLAELDLLGQYPGLTSTDIRACGLFAYLRATGKL